MFIRFCPAFSLGLLGLVVLATCGCGGGLTPVTGTITQNGQPVAGASVAFLPKDEAPGSCAASGETDSAGRFSLSSLFKGQMQTGALPGEYIVTVQKVAQVEGIVDPLKQPPPQNELPPQYALRNQSPLTAVVASGKNDFTFEVK